MSKVYGKCYEEIGPFHDTRFIVGMLDRSSDKLERDRLLLFLEKLMKNKYNVKQVNSFLFIRNHLIFEPSKFLKSFLIFHSTISGVLDST